MNEILEGAKYSKWYTKLRDRRGKAAITMRLNRAKKGNFGDFKPLGQELFEMRISYGPGYRIYYVQEGEVVYLLLIGGNKSSQSKDIEAARRLSEELKG